MPTLRLAHTNKAIREYYASLRRQPPQHVTHDSPITVAFAALLEACAEQFHWTLVQQYEQQRKPHRLCMDGALVDRWALAHGFWGASGEREDLAIEARKKIDQGYSTSNTLFQAPQRILLYRDGQPLLDESIVEPQALVQVLKEYFGYRRDAYEQWERAADEFKDRIPQLAQVLLNHIDKERHASFAFRPAFSRLVEVCRQSLGPSLSEAAVEKMLAQHVLAEGIFRTMFDDPDFARANPFAQEFEQAAAVLAQVGWSQDRMLSELGRFHEAIRSISFAVEDFAVKQQFLASIYEAFFQGFDARTPTPYAIVHTPPPIIRFMVRSVDALLHEHLGHSLSDPDVHVLDPFAGTGSFIVGVLSQIARNQLTAKYESDLHANEILLLPYYIASMNIDHEYAEITGERRPFQGLCLADTFELAEAQEQSPGATNMLNAERVEQQRRRQIKVILGNPPHDAWQLGEYGRSRDRKYPVIDRRVAETYARDSAATFLNSLDDTYVKALRWASDRLGTEGVLAYVSDSSYMTRPAFEGMRKHLAKDFDVIYLLDLGGNVRKNPRLPSATHNIFGLQLGICIGLFVRQRQRAEVAAIFYARTEDDWRNEERYRFLDEAGDHRGISWTPLEPDARHTWLLEPRLGDFESFPVPRATQAVGPRDPRVLAAALDALGVGAIPVETLARKLQDASAALGPRNLDVAALVEECKQLRWIELRSGRLTLTQEGRHAADAGRVSPHRFARMLCLDEYHRDTVTQILSRLWELNPQNQGAVLLPVPEVKDDLPHDSVALEEWSAQVLRQHWEMLRKNVPGLRRAPSPQPGPAGFDRTSPRLRRRRFLRWTEDQTLELLFGDICSAEATRVWQTRTEWAGLTVLASELRGVRDRVWFPVGAFRDTDNLDFVAIPELRLNRTIWYCHVPNGPQAVPKFVEELFAAYLSFSAAGGREYVSLMAVRDTVCYQLRLSREVFQQQLAQSLSVMTRGDLPYSMSLEVDITPQQRARLGSRIPIVIDGIPRYIIAMSSKQQLS